MSDQINLYGIPYGNIKPKLRPLTSYSSLRDKTCGACWGSGWAVQFKKVCEKCNGEGKRK